LRSGQARLKVGFLGVGSVARYHAEVVHALGHVVTVGCGQSPDSPRWAEFKTVAPQARFESNGQSLLENPEIDAVVSCLPWNVTETWLPELLSTQKPVLLEKPIALSSDALAQAMEHAATTLQNKYVGFNRRFYQTAQELKKRVEHGGMESAEITISEMVESLAKTYGEDIVPHILAYSSSHILDTARYILGPLNSIRVYASGKAQIFSPISGLLETGLGAPVHLSVLSENPVPVGIRIFFDDQTTWHLSPMERLTAYKGYDRSEPTAASKIRRYTPKPFLEMEEDSDFKPGFLEQMRDFTEGEGRHIAATTIESLELLTFIESVQREASGHAPVGRPR